MIRQYTIAIATEAIASIEPAHYGLLLDICQRGALMRGAPFQVTYRSLESRHGLHGTEVRSVLEFLAKGGWLTLTPGTGRQPTEVCLHKDLLPVWVYEENEGVPGTPLYIYRSDQERVSLDPDPTRDDLDQDPTRDDLDRDLDPPKKEVPREALEAREIWEHWRSLSLPDGTSPHARARALTKADKATIASALKEHSKEELLLILDWAHLAPTSWWRENGYLGIYTLLKPKGRSDRLEHATRWDENGRESSTHSDVTNNDTPWERFAGAYRAKHSSWASDCGGIETPLYRTVGRLGGSIQLMERWRFSSGEQRKALEAQFNETYERESR